ncbi:MAG: tRNA 2-selenouridine(34) synthase MnmH [Bacteroidales bacterium]|nr:tRNA 2-selenouridine(34) synthase MnmH [Bacteroidales bacterium]
MTFQLRQKLDVNEFLKRADSIPVVDVRSPSEFMSGHIPGAYNIPLFDDDQRKAVGIKYKESGRNDSIIEGLRLTGPLFHTMLETALKISDENRLLVHCWRGGMRSEAMAWLFSQAGIEADVLEGGYKAYRQHILNSFTGNKKMIILGGLTGSGKTEILRYLRNSGEQVLDLEGLANHKGSAFGSLGQNPQPTSEHFANLLYEQWRRADSSKPLWVEDESKNIGTVFMPGEFYLNMQKQPAVVLLIDLKIRLPRLVSEYAGYPAADLISSVRRISKRLGGNNSKEAISSIEKGNFAKAAEIALKYYDKAYLYGLKKKPADKIIYIESDTDDIRINAEKILKASKSFQDS